MSFYSLCLVVLVVYAPYWILVGTFCHLVEFSVVTRPLHSMKKLEHTSDNGNDGDDNEDNDNEIDSNSGGMVLRVVMPCRLH